MTINTCETSILPDLEDSDCREKGKTVSYADEKFALRYPWYRSWRIHLHHGCSPRTNLRNYIEPLGSFDNGFSNWHKRNEMRCTLEREREA